MNFEQLSKSDLVKEARKLDQEAKVNESKIADLESELAKLKEVVSGQQGELTHNAVGFYQGDDKLFYVASLKFNPSTRQASVEELVGNGQAYRAYDQALRKLEKSKV